MMTDNKTATAPTSPPSTMTPQEFQAAAVALFGDIHWRAQIADALNVPVRKINYWMAGQRAVPRGVVVDVLNMLAKRNDDIDAARASCRRVLRAAQ